MSQSSIPGANHALNHEVTREPFLLVTGKLTIVEETLQISLWFELRF